MVVYAVFWRQKMTEAVAIIAQAAWWSETINYELVRGNAIWRFGLVLIIILATMAAGRIVQFFLSGYSARLMRKKGEGPFALLLTAIVKPVYVVIFAAGIYIAKLPLYFNDEDGIRIAIGSGWTTVTRVVAAISVAYALYRLVDVIEYYLNRLVGRTETKLDDMLVPVVRKAMRVTIAIISILLIAENVLGGDQIKSLLLGAGSKCRSQQAARLLAIS